MMTRAEADKRQVAAIDQSCRSLLLLEILTILSQAPRDAHGVFYSPQSTLQRIAEVLGRPAPDAIDDG